ncbi:hypothetical protein HYW75_03065, partial [Candidatus Pacearchaeota archaeon]|nr:hypothetical protein [Candidatus Pacearchaeota archaeon]
YGVGYIEAGQNVNVRVNVRDQSDISFVNSTIKNSNENIVGSLELYDDGLHGDDLAGDGIYGNYWSTPINEEDYTIDISSEDSFENSITFEKLDKFTTKPFTVDSDILLVDSAFYYSDRSYISYFEEALNSNNVDYKLWDYGLRGRINNNILNSFGAIIWSSPSWKMPTIEEQEGLIDFLNNKGRLFITGQDFGFYLNGTDFYDNYLHARYVQDDANLLGLSGTNGDPISDGLAINIFGDGGANNQFWPSEIDPISPATSVFVYNNLFPGDSNLPQEIPIAMLPQKEKPKGVNTASSTASSGSGAIKVDTGVYKVVYFAFGFEAINDANDRSIIMDRVLDWFSDFNVYSPNQSIYTDSRVPFNISSEKVVDKITWIDNSDERSRERTLCSRFCTSYGNDRKKLQSFNDGFHSVTFKTLKNNTVDKEKTINFVVDTKDPKISKTNPKSGFSNGNFSVEFVEQNPQSLILHYGNNQTGFETKDFPDDCNFKRDKWSCFTIANLSTYDNQSIEYWFELHDIINNTVISKKNFVKADTTLPVINLFKYDIGLFRRVTFTLNITELNFDKVNYIDWNDLRPSPRVLCSGLKNNVCTITKSFRSGTHNLTIGVFDKSGNSANKNLSFVI